LLESNYMKKNLIKSGWIATIISIVSGVGNLIASSFKGNVVGAAEGVNQSIPWLQTLLVMMGVFLIVFIFLIVYYFVIKRKIESI